MSGGRKIRFLLGNAALHTCDVCYFKKRKLEKDSRELKEEMVSRCAEGPGSLGGNIGKRDTHVCLPELQSQANNIFSWCLWAERAEPCVWL